MRLNYKCACADVESRDARVRCDGAADAHSDDERVRHALHGGPARRGVRRAAEEVLAREQVPRRGTSPPAAPGVQEGEEGSLLPPCPVP